MTPIAPVVLLATCDHDPRELFRPVLARHGASVVHVADGEWAFQEAHGLLPAVVVADLGAATVNALALRDRLKRHERTRHIPISVQGSPEARARAVQLVVVPLTAHPDELLRSISSYPVSSSQSSDPLSGPAERATRSPLEMRSL